MPIIRRLKADQKTLAKAPPVSANGAEAAGGVLVNC
jgi:hypothetical protein